jgi:membrane protein implicated in regulation of membrane protease activity
MFIATLGGSGIIFKKLLGWPAYLHLPLSAISGVAVAGSVAYLFWKLLSGTQGSSQARAEEAIGLDAEVTVPIPHDGLGEITYTVAGLRYVNPARTADGKELPARAIVKIVKQVGNTYLVQKAQ